MWLKMTEQFNRQCSKCTKYFTNELEYYKHVSSCTQYNGWSNYETWLMNLNLTNEQGIYNEIHSMAKHQSDDYKLGEQLKDYIEELFYNEDSQTYKICDVWTNRDFQEIDWYEIAQSLREE